MPSDLSAVERVSIGDYTVRVAQAGDCYEAVVCDAGGGGPSPGGLRLMMGIGMGTPQTGGGEDVAAAPVVEAPHYWVAVGLAVDAYERVEELDADAPDTAAVYDALEIAAGTIRANGETFEVGGE